MKVKCECGRQFDVADGAKTAKCPGCGRQVKVGGDDWLASLNMDDLAIDGQAPPPEPEKPKAAPGPQAAKAPGAQAPKTPEPQPAKAAATQAPRTPGQRGYGQAAAGAGKRQAPVEPPKGLRGLVKMARENPGNAVTSLREREDLTEVAVVAAVFVAMAVLAALAQRYLIGTGAFTGKFLPDLLLLVVELVGATIVLLLLTVLVKREPGTRPSLIGLTEGMILVRIIVLAALAPVAIGLVVAMMAMNGTESVADWLVWVAAHVRTVYVLGVLCGHMALVVPLLRMGCGASAILSLVLSFASYSFASKVVGMLGL